MLFRALLGYEEENPNGMPFSLALPVLPLCLQKDARQVIAENSRGYLLNGIYYEGANEQSIGKLVDGKFYYFVMNSGGKLINGNPAGHLGGDCIVSTKDGQRFPLIAVD